MTEGELKRLITDYLQYQMNLGQLLFLRLNAGGFPTQSGRWAVGVPAGCADLLILKRGRTIFIELKAAKGKVTLAQSEFARAVRAQGAEWSEIRDFEGLLDALAGA